MSRIAFIGDRDSVWGFRAFGIDVYPVSDLSDAEEILRAVIESAHAVVFVTEDIYESCGDLISEYRALALPTVTVLPSVTGSRGLAATEIHEAVSAAIGADILGESGES
jgi:V/A-type H+/Na+-transporting ATPase subunit F